MGIDRVDYAAVPQELKDKVAQWEKNKPENKQLAALDDLSATLEQLVITLEQGQTTEEGAINKLGALLTDMRTSLSALEGKEAPDSPDYASPVVEAVKQLETALTTALNAVEVKPEFTPTIHVDAPQVNVSPPGVDLKGVERILKDNIPAAFKAAIAAIPPAPETDLTPLLEQLSSMSEQLASIETASRMKPQAPVKLQVTNPDGTSVGSYGQLVPYAYDYIEIPDYDANNNPLTVIYRSGGLVVATLAITYDVNSNPLTVART